MAKIIKYEELSVETKDALNFLLEEEKAKDDPMTKSDELYLCQLELDRQLINESLTIQKVQIETKSQKKESQPNQMLAMFKTK